MIINRVPNMTPSRLSKSAKTYFVFKTEWTNHQHEQSRYWVMISIFIMYWNIFWLYFLYIFITMSLPRWYMLHIWNLPEIWIQVQHSTFCVFVCCRSMSITMSLTNSYRSFVSSQIYSYNTSFRQWTIQII